VPAERGQLREIHRLCLREPSQWGRKPAQKPAISN
jgi:hypothetical protein